MPFSSKGYKLLYIATLVASLGGFIIGYDMIVISGAIVLIKDVIAMSYTQQEIVVSSALFFAIIGAIFGWPICNVLGRKSALVIGSLLLIFGALFLTFATSYWHLVVGRSIIGLGVGLTSMAVPFYISEIVPTNIRGSCICLVNLVYFLGIFIAYLVDMSFSFDGGWRFMLGLSVLFPIVMFALLFYLPETPHLLISKNKKEKAIEVLHKLRRPYDVFGDMEAIEESIAEEKDAKRNIFSKGVFKVLSTGVLIAIFMEITGVDALMYYAPTILCYSSKTSQIAAITSSFSIGIAALVFATIAVGSVDWVGRRKLLLLGTIIMLLGLAALGLLFRFCPYCLFFKMAVISCFVAIVGGYALGFGAIGWLLISEIYPLKIRSFCISISITVKWIFNFIIARYLLSSIQWFNRSEVFWLFSAISAVSLVFVYYFVPETSGKSLEAIEEFWFKEKKHGTVIK